MDARQWERVESLFNEAMGRPAPERTAFVVDASGSDAALAREVLSLIDAATTDAHFLETPVVQLDTGIASSDHVADVERRVGKYRLVRSLGRGGMGEVFLAIHEGDDFQRSVAVKLIRKDVLSSDVARRFGQERRILARLRHPNIASLLDGGTSDDGVPFVVMEFVDGVRLDHYCNNHELSVTARLELLLQVCEAVQHAHRNLVIHRDLKPTNILVSNNRVLKLLDFGISKLLDDNNADEAITPVTRTELRLLTPEYASPEQLRGAQVSTASDVFSLGIVMYELLAGVNPWSSTNVANRLVAMEQHEPTRPSDVVATESERAKHGTDNATKRSCELAGDVDTIVLKALRIEPEHRYRTVDALADDIRRHLEGRPVSARADTFWYRTSRLLRRHRAGASATALVLVVLTAAATALLVQRNQSTARVTAERDKLRETQGFLLEMFGAVGPDESGGNDVSARALLDAQAARLASYADQPTVQAEIQYVLADGYQRLGLVDSALPLASAALRTRERVLAPRDPDIARARSLLSWIERERGNDAAAESGLRTAVGELRVSEPPAPEALSRALNDLGVVLGDEARHDEQRVVLEEALTMRRAAPGSDRKAVAITANNLAASYWQLGRKEEALALLDESVDALEKSLGPNHSRVWQARANRLVYRTQGLPAEERVVAWRAHLANAEERFGPHHREVAWARYLFANNLLHSLPGPNGADARLRVAEEEFANAVAVADSTFGPDHARTAVILLGRSDGYLLQRNFAASIATRERAAEIYRKVYGNEYREIGVIWRMQARAEFGRGDIAAGDRLAHAAWLHHQRAFGARHVTTLTQQVNVARRFTATGDMERAVQMLRDAVTGIDSLTPPRPTLSAQTRIALALALHGTGASADAEAVLAALKVSADSLPASIKRALEQAERSIRKSPM